MKKIPFTKMHGCGNDYIYINAMQHPIDNPSVTDGATAIGVSVLTGWC